MSLPRKADVWKKKFLYRSNLGDVSIIIKSLFFEQTQGGNGEDDKFKTEKSEGVCLWTDFLCVCPDIFEFFLRTEDTPF